MTRLPGGSRRSGRRLLEMPDKPESIIFPHLLSTRKAADALGLAVYNCAAMGLNVAIRSDACSLRPHALEPRVRTPESYD